MQFHIFSAKIKMLFVICVVAVSPLRSEASHRSEMVSQLLFGEAAEVVQKENDFIKIKCLYDDYGGWAQASQLIEVSEDVAMQKPLSYAFKRNTTVQINGTEMYVSVATPVFENIQIGNYKIEYNEEETLLFAPSFFKEEIIKMAALLYENVPYLWGGKSSFGIDCSGFVQQVFKLFQKRLPRDAYQQATGGEVVHFLEETQCGDLAFFDNDEGKIVHVGILLGKHEIIHASGTVRVDTIDSFGIINRTTGQRTHQLRVMKRV